MTTPVGRSQAPTPTPPGRDATHAGVASGGGATEEALQQPNFEADDDSSGEQVEPPHHDEDEEIVWSNDEDRAIDQAEAYMQQNYWGQEALVLRSLEYADDQRMGEASELIPDQMALHQPQRRSRFVVHGATAGRTQRPP